MAGSSVFDQVQQYSRPSSLHTKFRVFPPCEHLRSVRADLAQGLYDVLWLAFERHVVRVERTVELIGGIRAQSGEEPFEGHGCGTLSRDKLEGLSVGYGQAQAGGKNLRDLPPRDGPIAGVLSVVQVPLP